LVTLVCLEIAIISGEFRVSGRAHPPRRRREERHETILRKLRRRRCGGARRLGFGDAGECRAADRHAVARI
jgi:hypothetical protein